MRPMLLCLVQAAQLTVGPGGEFATVGAALAAARPGDTVLVAAGQYPERVVIDRPVVLLGRGRPVLDGEGRGRVVQVRAPYVTIRGFEIRGSGASQATEDAGIHAERAHRLRVEENRLADVLFGLYVKESDSVLLRDNEIVGKDLPSALRGDGVRLWSSHGGTIAGNRVQRVRDVVIWFSHRSEVVGNLVRDSRYGLHYMYSDDSRFADNRFLSNEVGAFIMYSRRIRFERNLFADARGPAGRGLGFKDADEIVAEANILVRNAVGLSLDNSPHSEGVSNLFRRNVLAYNDAAVVLLPSVKANAFENNAFVDNLTPVRVTGGGTALANRWEHNYWSEYAGFDRNRDGVGDAPYVFERLSDDLFARHEALRLFALSPASMVLDAASRILPMLKPQPLVIDSAPRIAPAQAAARGGAKAVWGAWAAWMLGATALAALWHLRLRRRAAARCA